MTEFSYKPYETITIKELVKHSLADFLKFYIPNSNGFLRWCDGVIFSFNTITESERMTNQRADGHLVWGYAAFAKMPKFEEIVKLPNGGLAEAPVVDLGADQLFVDFVAWLKSEPIWRDEK